MGLLSRQRDLFKHYQKLYSMMGKLSTMIDFIDLAEQCSPEIDIKTLSSLVRHESEAKPYAIRVNGDISLSRQPKNKTEAIETAEFLKANGYNFDACLGQINSRNLNHLKMSIPNLFDPCANLQGTTRILADCYTRASIQYEKGQPALQAALSCYNTGNFSAGFSNGYVTKVVKSATLPVPALLPMEESTSSPIRLQTHYSAQSPAHKNKKSSDLIEGLPDAFSKKKQDAFSNPEKRNSEFIEKIK